MARNHGIDAVRGFSILLVVLQHLALRIPPTGSLLAELVPERILVPLVTFGYEGVFVFFVISGFLITTGSFERWGELGRIDVRAFYALRFARIAPCLVLFVAVHACLHVAGVAPYVIADEGQSLVGATVAALGFFFNVYESNVGYLPGGWGVLWSLSVEEVFYLGFPLVCLALARVRLLVPALIALALSLPLVRGALAGQGLWYEKAYLPGMAAIAMGVATAIAVRSPRIGPRPRAGLIPCGLLGMGAFFFANDLLWPRLRESTLLVLTGSTACLLAGLHLRALAGRDRPPFGLRWLCAFGGLSYEIYLTHMFVVIAIAAVAGTRPAEDRLGFLWYGPGVALSWLVGEVLARSYSVPSNRALRRILLARRPT